MPFISSIRGNYRDSRPKENPTDSILNYLDVTGGDIVYTLGGYRIHMFTTVGNSEFKIAPKKPEYAEKLALIGTNLNVEALCVAGGAGGGSRHAGGGGAGGMVQTVGLDLAIGTYPTTVGGGGAGGANDSNGNTGGNSVFSTQTANGGGGGGERIVLHGVVGLA